MSVSSLHNSPHATKHGSYLIFTGRILYVYSYHEITGKVFKKKYFRHPFEDAVKNRMKELDSKNGMTKMIDYMFGLCSNFLKLLSIYS